MENLKNIAPVEDFNWEAYENGEAVFISFPAEVFNRSDVF